MTGSGCASKQEPCRLVGGITPFGHLPIVKRLLHQGAEVDARESEMQAGTDSIQAAVAGAICPQRGMPYERRHPG